MKEPTVLVEKEAIERKTGQREAGSRLETALSPEALATLGTIAESDADILARYPASAMKAAVASRLASPKDEKASKGGTYTAFRIMRTAAIPAAACAVLAVAFVTTQGISRVGPDADDPSQGLTFIASANSPDRAKGSGPKLNVYRKKGEEAVRLQKGDSVSANDVLQISYVSGGHGWGAILSVDGNGTVTRHFPDAGNDAGALDNSGEVALSFSYVLDDAPKYERFIFIYSRAPFSLIPVIKSLETLAKDPDFTTMDISTAMPKQLSFSDLVLVK